VVTATYTQKRIRGVEWQIKQSRNRHQRGEMEETMVKRYLEKFWVWKKEVGRGQKEIINGGDIANLGIYCPF
jgi:hypothetical protein